MTSRLITATALLACALPFVSADAQVSAAVPAQLQIGTQTFRIPSPSGFVETSRRAPEMWSFALAGSGGDARLIAHFVANSDLLAFERGEVVTLREFYQVQTPRRAESLVLTQAQFDKLRAGTVALQADLQKRLEPRLAAEVDRISKEISSSRGTPFNVRFGEIVPVSVDRNDERVLIYTTLMRSVLTEGNSSSNQAMVGSSAYCFLSGKVVMLASYRIFRTSKDVQASRKAVGEWANSVLSAN